MKIHIQAILLTFIFLGSSFFGVSQSIFAEHATGIPGDISTGRIFKQIDAINNLDGKKAASLKKYIGILIKSFYSDPQFNPPVGFAPQLSFGIQKNPLVKKIILPEASVSVSLYYLINDRKTGKVIRSMDGTSINFDINDIGHLCSQQGNFWAECSKLKLPEFFEKFPVVDSSADYIELNFKNYGFAHTIPDIPLRIIRRNSKAVFIPYTRREFFKYLLASANYKIRDNQNTIRDIEKDMGESKKNLSVPAFQSMKETILNTIRIQQEQIVKINAMIKDLKAQLDHYTELMNAMPPGEAGAAVRLEENKPSRQLDYFECLLPAGSNKGYPLYKVNADYFDTSSNAPGVQLMMVYYDLPSASAFIQQQDYLQRKTVDIFNQIDYHGLKENLQ